VILRKSERKHLHKKQARALLHKAVVNGKVIKPSNCEQCGGTNPQAHHHDYEKPLDVIWLCVSCHSKEHH